MRAEPEPIKKFGGSLIISRPAASTGEGKLVQSLNQEASYLNAPHPGKMT